VQKSVTFVYLRQSNNARVVLGTGFFVYKKLENPVYAAVYLVSAKHVFKNIDTGEFYNDFSIRVNKKDGTVEYIDFDLNVSGKFMHSDPDVDLIVIPISSKIYLDPRIYDFAAIPEELITTKNSVNKLGIGEGDDVFFCGLFTSHMGQKQNRPISRFGKVALLSQEKIEYKEKNKEPKMLDLYLIECMSFEGNSGSPVFFILEALRNLREVDSLDPKIYFAGVITGAFDINEFDTYMNAYLKQNVGIAGVIPAYKLHEILDSETVKKNRNTSNQFAEYDD
jgi:hypothetical protein